MTSTSIISLIKKIYHSPTFNTWASIASRSLNIIVLIPFILKEFNPAEISLWYLFATIAGFNFIFELGFGPSFIRAISYGLGGASSMNNNKGNGKPNLLFIGNIWQNIKLVYAILTILILLILVIFGQYIIAKPISLMTYPKDGWTSWIIMIVGISFSFWGNIFAIFLQGSNKITLFRRYETIFSLCSIISCAIGIQLGINFVGLILLSQSWNVISVIRNYLICKKDDLYNKIKSKFTIYVDKSLITDLWSTSWRSAIGIIMSYGIINSSALYFAQSDDAKQVSSYLFCYRILQIIINFSMAPFYTKVPELSRLYITNDREKLLKSAKKGMIVSHFTFVISTILVGITAPYALEVIGSSIQFIEAKLWALLIFAFFIERFGAMHMQLYSISNNIIWHITNSITGIILLILLIFTIPSFNFYAFPISMIVAYLSFYSWYAAKKSYKLLNLKFMKFEKKITFVPLLVLLLYILLIFNL